MASDDATESLSSIPDNLTELHEQSDLTSTYTSRRTKSGFLVEGPLLQAFVPTPPSKRPRDSWIYDGKDGLRNGECIIRTETGEVLWLCRHCYDNMNMKQRTLNNAPLPTVFTCTATPTTAAQRHLVKHHGYDLQGNKVEQKRKRETNQRVDEQLKKQHIADASILNQVHWQSVFLRWVLSDNTSLRKTTSPALHKLLLYRTPMLEEVLPKAHDTARRWITRTFAKTKERIRRDLAQAKSRITLSFDGWKSDNELDLLGVVAHYIDKHYRPKAVLLALRNTYGSHTGEELHHHLLAVAREFKITTKLAYVMADNASNNDKALTLLSREIDLVPAQQRLRCTGHVIKLVCKATLYGIDVDCINDVIFRTSRDSDNDDELTDASVSRFEQELRTTKGLDKLKVWRKKGPIGKLHNTIVHARASPARRAAFAKCQKEVNEIHRIYQLVVNGGIRWNSTYDMIERAVKLKDAIDVYQQRYRFDEQEPLEDDALSADDWHELTELLALLKPLKMESKHVQSDPYDCQHGTLHEALTSIDFLMSKLESFKEQHKHLPSSHLKPCINLGWKKLNKYYLLSDQTSAYRAAIVLHPHYKMGWFYKHWSDLHKDWIGQAKEAVEELYKDYCRRHSDELQAPAKPTKELDEFTRYNTLDDDGGLDELERYLVEARAPADVNLLQWWKDNEHRYSILSHMAFDLLATPASSAADERQFSKAGHVLNEERFNTLDDLAEAYQCLKNWYEQDLVDEIDTGGSEPNDLATPLPTVEID